MPDHYLTRGKIEDDFRLSLRGYKQLSEHGQELVKKQIGRIIDFVSECERRTSGLTFEEQALGTDGSGEVREIKLGKLDEQTGKKKGNKK
jgi:hypothetical protein